jgi:hypothetical protein
MRPSQRSTIGSCRPRSQLTQAAARLVGRCLLQQHIAKPDMTIPELAAEQEEGLAAHVLNSGKPSAWFSLYGQPSENG